MRKQWEHEYDLLKQYHKIAEYVQLFRQPQPKNTKNTDIITEYTQFWINGFWVVIWKFQLILIVWWIVATYSTELVHWQQKPSLQTSLMFWSPSEDVERWSAVFWLAGRAEANLPSRLVLFCAATCTPEAGSCTGSVQGLAANGALSVLAWCGLISWALRLLWQCCFELVGVYEAGNLESWRVRSWGYLF